LMGGIAACSTSGQVPAGEVLSALCDLGAHLAADAGQARALALGDLRRAFRHWRMGTRLEKGDLRDKDTGIYRRSGGTPQLVRAKARELAARAAARCLAEARARGRMASVQATLESRLSLVRRGSLPAPFDGIAEQKACVALEDEALPRRYATYRGWATRRSGEEARWVQSCRALAAKAGARHRSSGSR